MSGTKTMERTNGAPATGAPASDRSTEKASMQTVEQPTGRTRRLLSGLLGRLGPAAVWRFTGVVFVAAAAASWFADALQPIESPIHLRWWMLAILFYFGEITVVHLRFRQNAHSFSMSEIPLVLALFFASPAELIVAQLVGNAIALIVNRRQSVLKVAFNLSQFTLVAALAAIIFHGIVAFGDPLGPAGWLATAIATWTTILLADALITGVIHTAGGKLDLTQSIEVIELSMLGGTINASLGLIAVFVLWNAPQAAWLGLIPPAVMYLGYRGIAMQRIERTRLQAMYEATRELHEAPLIDAALEIAARHAMKLLDAEFAEVVLFADETKQVGYSTRVGPGEQRRSMQPVYLGGVGVWEDALDVGTAIIAGDEAEHATTLREAKVDEAVIARIPGGNEPVGVIVAVNRIGDVSVFDQADAKLLSTLASQVSVSLENGRLEDSLAEVTRLKERLEDEIRSKDQFVASVSHELRTPLTAIVGLSGELMANPDAFSAEEHAEIIGLISSQSSDLAHIIEDLLVGARADMGTLTLQCEVLDLVGELESAIEGQLQAEITAGVSGLEAWVDPLRFRQIIRNLLTNAARYGGDRVWIEGEANGALVAIDVCDDGRGVPAEKTESIFEAYERAHNAAGQPGSVGLGLAVARKLARLMGGDLIYLRRNGTTVFRLSLRASPPAR